MIPSPHVYNVACCCCIMGSLCVTVIYYCHFSPFVSVEWQLLCVICEIITLLQHQLIYLIFDIKWTSRQEWTRSFFTWATTPAGTCLHSTLSPATWGHIGSSYLNPSGARHFGFSWLSSCTGTRSLSLFDWFCTANSTGWNSIHFMRIESRPIIVAYYFFSFVSLFSWFRTVFIFVKEINNTKIDL